MGSVKNNENAFARSYYADIKLILNIKYAYCIFVDIYR